MVTQLSILTAVLEGHADGAPVDDRGDPAP